AILSLCFESSTVEVVVTSCNSGCKSIGEDSEMYGGNKNRVANGNKAATLTLRFCSFFLRSERFLFRQNPNIRIANESPRANHDQNELSISPLPNLSRFTHLFSSVSAQGDRNHKSLETQTDAFLRRKNLPVPFFQQVPLQD